MLLTEQFCYHPPFHRVEWRLRTTHGIELRRDIMCFWHNHLATPLLPLHQRIGGKIRASGYLKVDETPIRCLEPGHGRTIQGYLWTYHHPEHGVLFDWHTSRGADCLKSVLIGEKGAPLFPQRCPTLKSQVGINLGETGHGLVPVALEVQMVFQPAYELRGALGEPLDHVPGDAGLLVV